VISDIVERTTQRNEAQYSLVQENTHTHTHTHTNGEGLENRRDDSLVRRFL
jgi:hypothetical protein